MVDRSEIEKIAELAKLDVDERLIDDAVRILEFVEKIEEFSVDRGSQDSGSQGRDVAYFRWREDRVEDTCRRYDVSSEDLIDRFPEKEGRFLKMPHILKGNRKE